MDQTGQARQAVESSPAAWLAAVLAEDAAGGPAPMDGTGPARREVGAMLTRTAASVAERAARQAAPRYRQPSDLATRGARALDQADEADALYEVGAITRAQWDGMWRQVGR